MRVFVGYLANNVCVCIICVYAGADPGGSSGGSDEPPLAPKITHSMCLSDLL